MPIDLSHPSICRENVLNALGEVRACRGDLWTYVAGAFDRLDKLVEDIGAQKGTQEPTQRRAEQDSMQVQIDQLAQLATELARSVAEHRQLTPN